MKNRIGRILVGLIGLFLFLEVAVLPLLPSLLLRYENSTLMELSELNEKEEATNALESLLLFAVQDLRLLNLPSQHEDFNSAGHEPLLVESTGALPIFLRTRHLLI